MNYVFFFFLIVNDVQSELEFTSIIIKIMYIHVKQYHYFLPSMYSLY
jgi:hypothetical protein